MRDSCGHKADIDIRDPRQSFADVLDPAFKFAFVANSDPLKRRFRVWNESVKRRDDLARTAKSFSGLEHSVLDTFDKNEHLVEVFLCFGRQTNHHGEFDGQHSAVENRSANIDDLVIGEIFIYYAPQSI